ncbi:MAG TPA: cytochrome c [Longimicrobiales bacterium]|nr:cytochrome c [Longimicrobiales bacterium]
MAGFRFAVAAGLLAVAGAPRPAAAQDQAPPPFTAAQVAAGAELYAGRCAECHGADLEGTLGPPLVGDVFRGNWYAGDRTAADLFAQIAEFMPMTAPGSLSPEEYAAITAFLLARNGHRATGDALVPDPELLDAYTLVPPDAPDEKEEE